MKCLWDGQVFVNKSLPLMIVKGRGRSPAVGI